MGDVDAINTPHSSQSELVQTSTTDSGSPTAAQGINDVVHLDHLLAWVDRFGPGIGLHMHPKSLPACWAQHPIVIHELTGLFLAWSALMDLFNPSDPFDDLAQVLVPAPRDWLDLTNAGAPAVERVKKDTTLCARSGRHVG